MIPTCTIHFSQGMARQPFMRFLREALRYICVTAKRNLRGTPHRELHLWPPCIERKMRSIFQTVYMYQD